MDIELYGQLLYELWTFPLIVPFAFSYIIVIVLIVVDMWEDLIR